MSNFERTGYRDILFSTWHRLIPGVKGIDLDFLQYTVDTKEPTIVFETKEKRNAAIIDYGLEWRVPYSLTKKFADMMDAKGALVTYRPRYPKEAFDREHSSLLEYYYQLDKQIRYLSEQKLSVLRSIIRHCHYRYGPERAYDSFISQVGIKRIMPDLGEPIIKDSTIPLKNMLQRHSLNGSNEVIQTGQDIILPDGNLLTVDEAIYRLNNGKTQKQQYLLPLG